jgi:hypothetical protein
MTSHPYTPETRAVPPTQLDCVGCHCMCSDPIVVISPSSDICLSLIGRDKCPKGFAVMTPATPSHGSLICTFADCDCIGSLTDEGWYICKSRRTIYLSCDMNRYKGTCPYGFAHVRREV